MAIDPGDRVGRARQTVRQALSPRAARRWMDEPEAGARGSRCSCEPRAIAPASLADRRAVPRDGGAARVEERDVAGVAAGAEERDAVARVDHLDAAAGLVEAVVRAGGGAFEAVDDPAGLEVLEHEAIDLAEDVVLVERPHVALDRDGIERRGVEVGAADGAEALAGA